MQIFTHQNGRAESSLVHRPYRQRRLLAASKSTCATLLFSFLTAVSFAQNGPSSEKIDPAFRYLQSQQSGRLSASAAFPSPYKLEVTTVAAARGATPEKRYNCIVYTKNGRSLRDSGLVVNSVLPTFATVSATLEQINRMAGMKQVQYIEAPARDTIQNDIAVATTGASLLHSAKLNNTVYKGKGVIVAVYDTGIDWDHPDFRDPLDQTKSRILRIWDQTISPTNSGEASPAGYSYGVEYTQAQLNDELDGSPAGFVREKDINGHGTHVAGTAAGNGMALANRRYTGMAPEADLIIIKGGNGSFPTTNTVDAITYLKGLANTLGRPIVLNMSIGGQSGPHDGTLAHELAVDDFTASGPGRVVVISAGNDNGTAIHNRFTLTNSANNAVQVTVPSGTAGTDVFQYSCYANAASSMTVSVTAPSGEIVSTGLNTSGNANVINNGFTVYVTNSILASDNNRYLNIYVARNGTNTENPTGTWTITVTNNSATTLTMDGWLNYISTSFTGTALVGGDNNYLVGSPGNATSAITAASFVGRLAWYSNAVPNAFNYTGTTTNDNLSTFSSWGPRRDGLQKPEIAATGQAVISCLSSDITPAPTASDVIEVGLYKKDQGTSMASPVTAGAVALLLQTNNNLTATSVKNLITSNATKDALTEAPGATPNARWGYGKLDVFRAAAASFSCSPADRHTLQYDVPFTSAQNAGVLFSVTSVAVRFTPDLTGRLGGVYFHTAATATVSDVIVEVRNSNGGLPGTTVLGSISLSAANTAKYSWNYLDFSSLNISVTNGTDYFVVIRRDPASSTSWSITRENVSVDGRSYTSTDNGATWTQVTTFDYKIRSVIYTTSQLSGTLVSSNATDTRNISSSNQFLSSCALISQLVPSGASPATGNVTSKVWIESSVPHVGTQAFVARHYEITPSAAAGTSTGRVTLYFKQSEFDAFNADAGSLLDLPTGPSDAAGKANLRVTKYSGTSGDGTGLPSSYSNGAVLIDPADADIVWNAAASRWEVSFDVTGFSGFILQTAGVALPVRLEYFTGRSEETKNLLAWKANCASASSVVFAVGRSGNGTNFTAVGAVRANQLSCEQPFNFTDGAPLQGRNYYRLQMTEAGGRTQYSSVILLKGSELATEVYPTLLHAGSPLQVSFAAAKGTLTLSDALGRTVFVYSLTKGVQNIDVQVKTSGVYYYSVKSSDGNTLAQGKLVIE